MNFKNGLIVFAILICILFSISCVAASDVNETGVTTYENQAINDLNEELIMSSQEDLLSSSEDDLIANSQEDLVSSANGGTFTELQKLINEAPVGATITLDKDYSYDAKFNDAKGIIIAKDLTINGNGHTLNGLSNSRILFTVFGLIENNKITLNNIVFKNGYTSLYGGAIFNLANLTVNNCVFENNYAGTAAGAICSLGSLDCKNSKFNKNTAKGDAGAIFSLTFEASLPYFNNNFKDLIDVEKIKELIDVNDIKDLNVLKDLIDMDEVKNLIDFDTLEDLNELANVLDADDVKRLINMVDIPDLNDLKNIINVDELKKFVNVPNLTDLNDIRGLMDLENLKNFITIKDLNDLKGIINVGQLKSIIKIKNLNDIKTLVKVTKLISLIKVKNLDDLSKLRNLINITGLKNLINITDLKNLINISKFQIDEKAIITGLMANLTIKPLTDHIYNCKFTNNVAKGRGGGAVYAFTHISILSSTFTSNSADKVGGAVYAAKNLVLKNSKFTSNKVSDYGGAVYFKFHDISGHTENGVWKTDIKYYTSSIQNCVFTENVAKDRGGAIYGFKYSKNPKRSALQAVKCTFKDNWATSDGNEVYGGTLKKCVLKNTMTLKTVKVKRSAKKLVLTAKLKKGSKVLKYKKVTFKFKNKVYKAKTNSKGIAKVTVPSKVLKKLKAGKKVTYQASYSKYIARKTVKVYK